MNNKDSSAHADSSASEVPTAGETGSEDSSEPDDSDSDVPAEPLSTHSDDQDFTFGSVQKHKGLFDVLKKGKPKRLLLKKALAKQRKNEKLKQTEAGKVFFLTLCIQIIPFSLENFTRPGMGKDGCHGCWREITR